MLASQAKVLELQEQQRHNRQTEEETWRSNRRNEQLQMIRDRESIYATYRDLGIKERYNVAQAEAARMNAVTNRINAINTARKYYNDWNVALDSNRIARMNAESNRFNALSNATNAQTNVESLGLQTLRTSADVASTYAGIRVSEWNAASNAMNARTNYEAMINQANRYTYQNAADVVNASANVLNSLTRGTRDMAMGMGSLNNLVGGM